MIYCLIRFKQNNLNAYFIVYWKNMFNNVCTQLLKYCFFTI